MKSSVVNVFLKTHFKIGKFRNPCKFQNILVTFAPLPSSDCILIRKAGWKDRPFVFLTTYNPLLFNRLNQRLVKTFNTSTLNYQGAVVGYIPPICHQL